MLLLSAMLLGGCGEQQSVSNAGANDAGEAGSAVEAGTVAGTDSENSGQSQNEQDEDTVGLKPAQIDYYNEKGLFASNYMSFILTRSKDTEETFVSVVDFGSDLSGLAENGFKLVRTDYGPYKFGLGTSEKAVFVGITKNYD